MRRCLLILALGQAAFAVSVAPAASPQDLPAEPEMAVVVEKILAMTGLHNDVRVVVDYDAKGCAYAATRKGRQYIGVNPDCVGPLRIDGRYNWRVLCVLTHEVGHLLGGHTINATNSHREESEADEWSGWALHRLGATLEQAQTAARQYSVAGSKSHPPRAVRLASVARGWRRAQAGVTPLEGASPKVNRWAAFLSRPLPWSTDR